MKTDKEFLEDAYRLQNGKLGSIPMSGNADCVFLDVEKETEKAVYFQFLGRMHWLPKSAFYVDKASSDEKTKFFFIKGFFYDQIMSKY